MTDSLEFTPSKIGPPAASSPLALDGSLAQGTTADSLLVAQVSPEQAQTVRRDCERALEQFLRATWSEVIDRGQVSVREVLATTKDFVERSALGDSWEALSAAKAPAGDALVRRMLQRAQDFPAPPGASDGARRGLSLMAEGEENETMPLPNGFSTVETPVAGVLDEVGRLFGALVGAPVTRANNPYGLEIICHGFRESFQQIKLADSARQAMDRVLLQSLMGNGPGYLATLKRTLATIPMTRAVLPPAAPSLVPGTPRPAMARAPAPHIAAATPGLPSGGLSLELIDVPPISTPAATRPIPSTAAAAPSPTGAALPSLDFAPLAFSTGTPPPATSVAATASAPPHSAATDASPAEVLAAIRSLAPAGTSRQRVNGALEPITVVVQRALATRTAGRAAHIPADIAARLATVGDLTATARARHAASAEVDALLARAERPLLKLVTAQRDGLRGGSTGVASRLVSLLGEYASGCDDQGRFIEPKTANAVSGLLDRLDDAVEREPAAVDTILATLERDVDGLRHLRRQRVQRYQEALEGRQRIRDARERVADALRTKLSGRKLPRPVLRALDMALRHALIVTAVRTEPGGTAWQQSLTLLDRLTAWFDPALAASPSRTPAAAETLLADMARTLDGTVLDNEELHSLMAPVRQCLLTSVHGSTTLPELFVVPQFAGDGADIPPGDLAAANALRVGDWWEITVEQRRALVQLIWLSHNRKYCAFANTSASNKLEYMVAKLLKAAQTGGARAVPTSPSPG
ncbi:MAG: DUF1631 family protein [Burkholderiales bacterium]|nr:DUF1631 family protein [Burkholderiales bacterium]